MNERKDNQDKALDEALDESFPASDPPANTVETGIVAALQDDIVFNNKEARRFELKKNGQLAFLNYERTRDAMVLVHTEVPASLRGHHIADALVVAGLAAARAEGLRIVPKCQFVQAYLRKHPKQASK
jgi:predicted GNAT family acetyltransferase